MLHKLLLTCIINATVVTVTLCTWHNYLAWGSAISLRLGKSWGLAFINGSKNQRGFHHGPGDFVHGWMEGRRGGGKFERMALCLHLCMTYTCLCENEIWMSWMRYFDLSISWYMINRKKTYDKRYIYKYIYVVMRCRLSRFFWFIVHKESGFSVIWPSAWPSAWLFSWWISHVQFSLMSSWSCRCKVWSHPYNLYEYTHTPYG